MNSKIYPSRISRDFRMTNAWPVVVRELRAESRRPINYGLRMLTAAVIVSVFGGFLATVQLDPSQLGASLFEVLEQALWLAIWIIVPMMTADCISREKREGTLGLLFLTPLRVPDVIMAKAATHVLRAATLLLASVPMLVLPFVLGGVVWQQVVLSIASIANALLLGIAAGIYASAKGGSAIQVMVMAEIGALFLALVFGLVQYLSSAAANGSRLGWLWQIGTIIGFTLVVFPMVIAVSVRVLRETWDQDSAAPEQPKWVANFSDSEFFQSIFRWERSKTLDRNPMAWLQEYSWTARLTKWGWFLGLLVAEDLALFHYPGWQPELTMVLSFGVAFSATGSFRRERQSGLLEVLLVTPLSVRQLMVGRLWGIFAHFVPALVLLMVCWNGDRLLNHREFYANPFVFVNPNPLAFLALMVVGLYLSLWRLNFLIVWLLAWALAFFLPAISALALGRFESMHLLQNLALTSAFQVALAAACWFLLRRNLAQRRFVSGEVS
jgi:ABC-type transport system involved in multi-copper enzyme maturation permease subunit